MTRPILLIVEDDQDLREALIETANDATLTTLEAPDAEAAMRILATQPVDMVCSDVNMPGKNGMQLLQRVQSDYPGVPVVLMTAYGSIEHSVQAIQKGAVDYLVKPFRSEVFIELIEKYLSTAPQAEQDQPVAEEDSSKQLLQIAQRVAATEATVLITGESGTGKEVLARYIHDGSTRRNGPFVAINCAAIPENMLEATLFGYEKGAFTGAHTSREGKFEQANGGTILLDEISEMDAGLQAKLLRVLQEREVERLGGKHTLQLDVRVVATSNRDLKQCVSAGSFREDLFYRLSVFPLQRLPLRQRRGDILPIARSLIAAHCRKMGRATVLLDGSAEYALRNHDWPGNVRELDNTIQRALVLQDGGYLTATSLSLEQFDAGQNGTVFNHTTTSITTLLESQKDCSNSAGMIDPGMLDSDLKQREYEVILSTLKRNRGKRKQTAEKLGISARTLRYKIARMREIGIDIEALIDA
ncbi:MAG: response regulator [Pseudomonadales bacterium]|nr:response regulator [Pseudomonadales bacterium]